jgi:hypothetical protein
MKFAHNSAGPYTRTNILANSEYQAGLDTDNHQSPAVAFKSWGRWLASVLCTSLFISYIVNGGLRIAPSIEPALQTTGSKSTHTRIC